MNVPPPPDGAVASPPGGAAARVLRYAYRTPLLLWHLFVDLPLVMLAITPLTGGWLLPGGERLDHRLIRAWSVGMARIFGFQLHRVGMPVAGATLFVANHVSWIDIVVLHSQRMMGFVAKQEISRWFFVGWLAGRGETIFHQRGSQESLGGVLQEMMARLRGGRSVGVFPEGRTRDGRVLGPFHARIFLAAVEAGATVQPVALKYGIHACAQPIVAFQPGESFMANFVRLLGEPARRTEVMFLQPIEPGDAEGRRRIAELARERITAALQAR